MYTRRTATKTTKLEIMLTVRRLYLEVYLVVNNRILFIAIVFKLPKQIVLPLFVGGGIDGGDNDHH